MYNTQRLDTFKYDSDFIVSESKIYNTHIDKTQPRWGKTFIQNNRVEDETTFFQFGDDEAMDFHSLQIEGLGLSYADQYPEYYKIAGFTVFRSFSLNII